MLLRAVQTMLCRGWHLHCLAGKLGSTLRANTWSVLLRSRRDELPERLLGTCRLEHLDLNMAAQLDTKTGGITRKALD